MEMFAKLEKFNRREEALIAGKSMEDVF